MTGAAFLVVGLPALALAVGALWLVRWSGRRIERLIGRDMEDWPR